MISPGDKVWVMRMESLGDGLGCQGVVREAKVREHTFSVEVDGEVVSSAACLTFDHKPTMDELRKGLVAEKTGAHWSDGMRATYADAILANIKGAAE